MHLTYKLEEILQQFRVADKPTLIFCSTRKGAELTAEKLGQLFSGSSILTDFQSAAISQLECRINHPKLLQMTKSGIAYYHDVLHQDEKETIQELFKSGNLPILVATNCINIDLQAYLVIIKSTNVSAVTAY